MKKTLTVLIISCFIFACKVVNVTTEYVIDENQLTTSKKINYNEYNYNAKDYKSVVSYISYLDAKIAREIPLEFNDVYLNSKLSANNMFEQILEHEAFYKGDKIVKLLFITQMKPNFKDVKEFYYKNDSISYIRINQLLALKNTKKEKFHKEVYYKNNVTVFSDGLDYNKSKNEELMNLAIQELKVAYKTK